jgi:hypothetical protein
VGASTLPESDSEASSLAVAFAPGLDFFIAQNLSLGVDFTAGYWLSRGYRADGRLVQTRVTSLSGGARVGWNVPLGAALSWYPRFTFGIHRRVAELRLASGSSISTPASPLGDATAEYLGPWVSLFAPVLLHPRSHFFIGLGPSLHHGFGSERGAPEAGGERTVLGASLVVGGFWGGSAQPAAAPDEGPDEALTEAPERKATAPHRFGTQGQVVLSGESALYVRRLTYSGADASSTEYALAPAVDYFVVDQVPLGLALFFSSSSGSGIDPLTGLEVRASAKSGGGAIRLGFDVPMGSRLSFDPRLSFALSVGKRRLESGADAVASTRTALTMAFAAPLLLHVAPHAFVGFGPSVSRDLQRTAEFEAGSVENPGTALRASLIVGGWID